MTIMNDNRHYVVWRVYLQTIVHFLGIRQDLQLFCNNTRRFLGSVKWNLPFEYKVTQSNRDDNASSLYKTWRHPQNRKYIAYCIVVTVGSTDHEACTEIVVKFDVRFLARDVIYTSRAYATMSVSVRLSVCDGNALGCGACREEGRDHLALC